MPSTSTMALIEHESNGDAVLEVRAIGAHYPEPAKFVPYTQTPADSESIRNANSPLGDDRLAHLDTIVPSANANANTSGNTGDGDNMTQSSATDGPGGSSDGTDSETEALEREMERYVPRTRPSKPAIGAQPSNPPPAQSKATNNISRPSGTKSGRPPAVTATTKTTASRPKK